MKLFWLRPPVDVLEKKTCLELMKSYTKILITKDLEKHFRIKSTDIKT